jgi:hypothetical protein
MEHCRLQLGLAGVRLVPRASTICSAFQVLAEGPVVAEQNQPPPAEVRLYYLRLTRNLSRKLSTRGRSDAG